MASVRGGLFEDEPVQRSSRPGTGLAALFSNSTPQASNVDLAYKPQKQPQPQAQPQTESPPTVIFGVTVQLFQFDSAANKFVLKGKVGAAILGSRSVYQLLLYQNNKQQISITTISADFAYTIQNNVYGTYYDDSRQSWSLLFKDQAECNKFASYVAIAKVGAGGYSAIKFQDILVGPKGKGVSAGDSIGVKYSGWLIDDQHHIAAMIDSNAEKDGYFKFVVGEGKVIRGWEEGVIGMKKGGKRLVAIPSHLAYGKNGYPPTIPPNANLLFEIEIVRMKKGNNVGVDESTPQLPSLDTNESDTPALMQNQGGAKSDLVARMAKVGRPAMGGVMTKSKQEQEDGMIPQRESEASDYSSMISNVPVENPHQHAQQMQMQQMHQQLQQHQQHLPQQLPQQFQQYPPQPAQPAVNSYQFAVTPQAAYPQFSQYPQSQVQPQAQPVPTQVNPGSRATSLSNSDAIQFLLEERQFQAEIKTSLSQVMSKVDDVENTIAAADNLGKGQSKSDDYMSGLVIIQNVHRVVDENEKLRTELNQKGEAVDNLRSKISALLEKNEKLIQENTRLLEQRTDSLKESSTQSHKQIQELLDAKKKLEKELNEIQLQSADTESKYLALNRNVNSMKQELESAREDIQKKTNEIELLKSKEISSESSTKKLTSKLEEETTLRKSLQEANQALKDQLADQEENINRLKKDKEKDKIKFSSAEAKWKEKKAALKTQIAQLQQALKTEGMNKEEIEKMEQDFRNKLKKQEVEIATRVRHDIENIDKPNWEFHAFNKGKLEGIQQGILQGAQQAQAETELRTQAVRDQAFKEGKEAGYTQARIDLSSSTVANPKQVEEAYQRGYAQGKQDGFASGKQSGFSDGLAQGKQQSNGSGKADVTKLLQEAKKEKDETVKKVMNSVYFALYEEIDEDESYAGSQVLQLMMQTIKAKTLEMIQQDASAVETQAHQEPADETSISAEAVEENSQKEAEQKPLQEEPEKEPQPAQPTQPRQEQEEQEQEEQEQEQEEQQEETKQEAIVEETKQEAIVEEVAELHASTQEIEVTTKEDSDREEQAQSHSEDENPTQSENEEPVRDSKEPATSLPEEQLDLDADMQTKSVHSQNQQVGSIDPLSSDQNDEDLDVPPVDNTSNEEVSIQPPLQLSTAEKSAEEEEEEDDDFGSDNEASVIVSKVETSSNIEKPKLFDDLFEKPSADPLKGEGVPEEKPAAPSATTESTTSAIKTAKVSLFGADEDDTEDFFSQVKAVDVTPKKEATPEPVKKPVSSTKVSLFGEDEDDGADILGFLAKKT